MIHWSRTTIWCFSPVEWHQRLCSGPSPSLRHTVRCIPSRNITIMPRVERAGGTRARNTAEPSYDILIVVSRLITWGNGLREVGSGGPAGPNWRYGPDSFSFSSLVSCHLHEKQKDTKKTGLKIVVTILGLDEPKRGRLPPLLSHHHDLYRPREFLDLQEPGDKEV